MFTGIVSKKIKVSDIQKIKNSLDVTFDLPKGIFLEEGESVSLNGICSTIEKYTKDSFQVHYMKETLDITKAKILKKGDQVNFEQSLKWNDKVSGHFVSGHIDCVGKVVSIKKNIYQIKIPAKFLKYVALKGSISIDGVSLTISRLSSPASSANGGQAKVSNSFFEVSLIPYTLEHTTLGNLLKGDLVNIEVDLLAKYAKKTK